MGLGEFAKLTRNRNTFEGLRNCNELYQHPASLLRKETRVLTRGSECKVSVLLQSARLKFPSSYRKLLDKVFFFNKFLSSSKENIKFIFFEGATKFWITGSSRPFSRLFWERTRFFHFKFKKGAEYEVILRDWRRWHWKVSNSSKLLLSRNFIYNKLKAKRNTQTPA